MWNPGSSRLRRVPITEALLARIMIMLTLAQGDNETAWATEPVMLLACYGILTNGPPYHGRSTMAKRIGFGDYQYEVVEDWPKVAIRLHCRSQPQQPPPEVRPRLSGSGGCSCDWRERGAGMRRCSTSVYALQTARH